MTETDYQRWLRDSQSDRCLLIVLHNSAEPLYLSSRPYTTRPTDSLANIAFRECLTLAPELSDDESLEIGDLEFTWPGKVVELRARYWRGYPFKIYLGASSWSFDDFRLIHSGFVDSVTRSQQDRLRVEFASAGMALEQSVATRFDSEVRLPVCLGSVNNVTPVLVGDYELVVHDGPVDSITVRIDGKPDIEHVVPNYSVNLSTGRIVFAVEIYGTVTADVVVNQTLTLESAIEQLASRRGIAAPVFDYFQFDLLNAPIGYYINDDSNYEQVLDDLADSVGAFVTHDAYGVMHIVYVDHERSADFMITDDDIVSRLIREVGELKELSEISLRFNQNYTVQSDIADYLTQWQTITQQNENNHYPDGWQESLVIDSYFTDSESAAIAIQRLADWRFVRRIRYQFTLFLRGVILRRGSRLRIESSSWGLSVTATVLSVERHPDSNRYRIEVIA